MPSTAASDSAREISVVIPCFNEGKTLYRNVKKVHGHFSSRVPSFEIILTDDGSTDETFQEMERLGREIPVKILRNPKNMGKGAAVRKGMLESRFQIVMFLDADLAVPVEEADKFIEEIRRGYDVVIASRFVPGLKVLIPVPWHRKIMERMFRLLRMSIINNWNTKDTQCGFKVFRREVALRVFSLLTVRRFSFDAEALLIARRMDCRIKELPITLQNPRASHIRICYDSVNMLLDLFRIRINDFRGRYDQASLP